MENESENQMNPAEVKHHLEALAGHEIDVSAEQFVHLLLPMGTYDYTEGQSVWSRIFLPGKTCRDAELLDASGTLSTGADGKRVFLLSEVVCLPLVRDLGEPINVLATARSTQPVFLTTTHAVIPNPQAVSNDVQLTVYAWDANGAPAPNVAFDWRCRVVSNSVVV